MTERLLAEIEVLKRSVVQADAERDALRERAREWDDVFVPSRKQLAEADALMSVLRERAERAEALLAASRAQVAVKDAALREAAAFAIVGGAVEGDIPGHSNG